MVCMYVYFNKWKYNRVLVRLGLYARMYVKLVAPRQNSLKHNKKHLYRGQTWRESFRVVGELSNVVHEQTLQVCMYDQLIYRSNGIQHLPLMCV